MDEMLRTLAEVAPAPLLVLDASDRYLYANPAACQLLGRRCEELVGTDLVDTFVRRERDDVTSYFRAVVPGQPGQRSMTVLRPDGQERDVVLSLTSFELGPQRLLAGMMLDVTESWRVQREAVALAQSAAGLLLTRSLEATLDALAQSVVETTSAVACGVYLLESDGGLRTAGTFGLPAGYVVAVDAADRQGAPRAARRAIETQATVIDEDVINRRLADSRFAPVHDLIRDEPWDVVVAMPLIHENKGIGAINTYYLRRGRPPEIEMSFLRDMANQAASAAVYARLLQASREKAALEERQRLARDLHDSVSQAVYGIALGARSAYELLSKDPTQVREPLEYILRLSEAALAEMRALIFELRPEALTREGLTGALKHHTAALRARHGITVEESFTIEPLLSSETKQGLYRIAQEALHNAARHARATRVGVALSQDDSQIRLEVSDDGVGFDPHGANPGHFGLNTMRERASELGGRLEIDSGPGAGTLVRAILPLSPSPRP
jgi:PAS domain S-box-containing protein